MIELIGKRIAVRPIFDPDVSPGGIIIPDQAKERCDQGIVKYVGPLVKDVKIGDYVIFSGYTGQMIAIEGEGKLIMFEEQWVVAKLDEVPKTDVPGLYFRSSPLVAGEYEGFIQDLTLFIEDNLSIGGQINEPKEFAVALVNQFPAILNEYWTATYEYMFELLGYAMQDAEWRKNFNVTQRKA